jgi:hypothetical protein
MADSYIPGAVLLFFGWLVVVQIKNWARWRSLKKFSDANGCGDMVAVPNKLPGGLDRVVMAFINGKIKLYLLVSRLSLLFLFFGFRPRL